MRSRWIALLVVACTANSSEPAPANTPPNDVSTGKSSAPARSAPPAAQCGERASRIEAELRELATEKPEFMPLTRGLVAPSAPGGEPIKQRGLVLAITKEGGLFARGAHFQGVDDTRKYVDAAYKSGLEKHVLNGGSSRDFNLVVYLWADRETPASLVARMAVAVDLDTATPAERARALASRARGDDPPPPPPEDDAPKPGRKRAIAQERAGTTSTKTESRVVVRLLVSVAGAPALNDETAGPAAKLPANEPEASTYVVGQLRSAIGSCTPIWTTLAATNIFSGLADHDEGLVKGIAAGLTKCECNVADLDALEWGVRTWFGALLPPVASIALPKLDANDKRRLGDVLTR